MRFAVACLFLAFSLPVSAFSQQADAGTKVEGDTAQTVSSALADGYEIKAVVPNGTKFLVFLQKDKSAVVCEFATLAKSQCGVLK
jgi:hypothetical protein